jgi:hypothetical protein
MNGLLAKLAIGLGLLSCEGKAAQIILTASGTNGAVQVRGDKDREWRVDASSDLTTWATLSNFAPLISSGTNPPARSVMLPEAGNVFLRAVETDGLYDPTIFRTISLTFTQANWATLLTSGRTTGSNTVATFAMDNGATNSGVGARYKGNTSFTMGGTKKSINLEFDHIDADGDLMNFRTVNLNNAAGDETIMREPLYFTIMSRYAISPKASMASVFINNQNWGVYSLTEQENKDLIDRWFPSNDGDRWSTPNAPIGGGGGGGGGFSGSTSALSYQGSTNASAYSAYYYLKATDETNTTVAWNRLTSAINVLNNTPAATFVDKVQDAFAVDRWLWFLAVENVFADDDSYFNKGADYGFYFEPESGRIHPVEHDGNEAFTAGDVSLSPVTGATGTNRPMLYKLLPIPEFRQRYLAHMRTVLEESFQPSASYPLVTNFHKLSLAAIIADPKKSFTMTAYTNDLNALKTFISQRYAYLTNHAELKPLQPTISAVNPPASAVGAADAPVITAQVQGADGIDSVWLYYRPKKYGRFAARQMFDDGAHGDGAAGDGLFGAATTNYPAGTKVRFYIEARSANAAKAARFSPARAEEETYNYRVAVATAATTPVIINELMASNSATIADPQGEFDDWIELRNITDAEVDLTGRYLSDEPNNPRKWQFPAGTKIPADGYLLVWADEDGSAAEGLHASFKLSASGEEVFLTDTDANLNAILDSVAFGKLETDTSYARSAADADAWQVATPTPNAANK